MTFFLADDLDSLLWPDTDCILEHGRKVKQASPRAGRQHVEETCHCALIHENHRPRVRRRTHPGFRGLDHRPPTTESTLASASSLPGPSKSNGHSTHRADRSQTVWLDACACVCVCVCFMTTKSTTTSLKMMMTALMMTTTTSMITGRCTHAPRMQSSCGELQHEIALAAPTHPTHRRQHLERLSAAQSAGR